MEYQQPDYMQINQRPDLNPKYVTETQEGEKLTQEESLFIYYMVLGYSKLQAFLKAGFTLPRRPAGEEEREKGISSNDKSDIMAIQSADDSTLLDPVTLQPVDSETNNLPGSAEKEKEENKSASLLYKLTQQHKQGQYYIGNKPVTEKEYLGTALMSAMHLSSCPRINKEYTIRLRAIESAQVADTHEIYSYLTAVMRGQVKDQFGLEASLQERTRAAEALAKRLIDMPAKLQAATAWAEQGAVTINIQPRVETVIEDANYHEVDT